MEARQILNEAVLEFYKERARQEFPEDVALLACYGSCINGTANRLSDADCFFIPATERGNGFAATYILCGVGYDLFPMSWERLEHIADLQESLCPLVGDSVVLYAKDEETLARFQSIRERMRLRLADRAYLAETVCGRVNAAAALAANLSTAETFKKARLYAGYLMMTLAEAALLHSGEYCHYGLKRQYEDLMQLPGIPREIPDLYRRVTEANAPAELRDAALSLLQAVAAHVGADAVLTSPSAENTARIKPDPAYLASLYEEISSTFNKIELCAETGNSILAFLTGVCLQYELDDAQEIGGPACDFLSRFDARDLPAFLGEVRRAEADFVACIEQMGGRIKRFDSFPAMREYYSPAPAPSSASGKSRTDRSPETR